MMCMFKMHFSHIICVFFTPTIGEIRSIRRNPRHSGALKGLVGVLPQDAALPAPGTVGSLLTYWARLSSLPNPEGEAREALERVELIDSWDTSIQALSYGMTNLIGLAQAVMGAPPVMLLDEPTAGLDPRIAAQLRQLMREMKGKRTLVVSSHNLHELEELCDAAAILDRGALVEAGTIAQHTSKSPEITGGIRPGNLPLRKAHSVPG